MKTCAALDAIGNADLRDSQRRRQENQIPVQNQSLSSSRQPVLPTQTEERAYFVAWPPKKYPPTNSF
jgi:hypothetical protein